MSSTVIKSCGELCSRGKNIQPQRMLRTMGSVYQCARTFGTITVYQKGSPAVKEGGTRPEERA